MIVEVMMDHVRFLPDRQEEIRYKVLGIRPCCEYTARLALERDSVYCEVNGRDMRPSISLSTLCECGCNGRTRMSISHDFCPNCGAKFDFDVKKIHSRTYVSVKKTETKMGVHNVLKPVKRSRTYSTE